MSQKSNLFTCSSCRFENISPAFNFCPACGESVVFIVRKDQNSIEEKIPNAHKIKKDILLNTFSPDRDYTNYTKIPNPIPNKKINNKNQINDSFDDQNNEFQSSNQPDIYPEEPPIIPLRTQVDRKIVQLERSSSKKSQSNKQQKTIETSKPNYSSKSKPDSNSNSNSNSNLNSKPNSKPNSNTKNNEIQSKKLQNAPKVQKESIQIPVASNPFGYGGYELNNDDEDDEQLQNQQNNINHIDTDTNNDEHSIHGESINEAEHQNPYISYEISDEEIDENAWINRLNKNNNITGDSPDESSPLNFRQSSNELFHRKSISKYNDYDSTWRRHLDPLERERILEKIETYTSPQSNDSSNKYRRYSRDQFIDYNNDLNSPNFYQRPTSAPFSRPMSASTTRSRSFKRKTLLDEIQFGARCELVTHPKRLRGSIQYIGPMEGRRGRWIGVELDDPEGSTDGKYNGKRYFLCQHLYGEFVKPNEIVVGNFPPCATRADANNFPQGLVLREYLGSHSGSTSIRLKYSSENGGGYLPSQHKYTGFVPNPNFIKKKTKKSKKSKRPNSATVSRSPYNEEYPEDSNKKQIKNQKKSSKGIESKKVIETNDIITQYLLRKAEEDSKRRKQNVNQINQEGNEIQTQNQTQNQIHKPNQKSKQNNLDKYHNDDEQVYSPSKPPFPLPNDRPQLKRQKSVFDRMSNPNNYTGIHRYRFNLDGTGKGKKGRDSPAKGEGTELAW